MRELVLIKGAGDLASGVAVSLWRAGFRILMTDLPQPTTVRCTVAFSRAVYEGACSVEQVPACFATTVEAAEEILCRGEIAITTLAVDTLLQEFCPSVLIDAILAKRNLGTTLFDAPLVIGLGPGFVAGKDCHAVIETKRGHYLGRVLTEGTAIPNSGVPGLIAGHGADRVLRAPAAGRFQPQRQIGELVHEGEVLAEIAGEPLLASISGVLRGLLPAGTPVHKGMKSGDIDPRGEAAYCYSVSDKARTIAGGVLEAILRFQEKRLS